MLTTFEEYLALPYTITLRKDKRDEIYVARVMEIPECVAHGETEQEALLGVRENLHLWIEDALESGDPIPVPTDPENLPSGKWLQRVPRELHRKLIQEARDQKASLNQFVLAILAEAIGAKLVQCKVESHPHIKVPDLGKFSRFYFTDLDVKQVNRHENESLDFINSIGYIPSFSAAPKERTTQRAEAKKLEYSA